MHVLGREPGERHGEVEPEAHVAAAVILEAIELLVGLVAPLARQDLEVLERRRVDRRKAIRPVDAAGDLQNPLSGQGLSRQMVAKSLERAGLDHETIGRRAGFGLRIDFPRFLVFRPSPTC